MLKAAKRFEPLDQRLARETYLEALTAVFFPGMLASDESVLETAQAAMAAPPSPQPPRASDLLLDGLALLITEGYAAGTPTLRRAVNAFRREDVSRGGRASVAAGCPSRGILVGRRGWDVLSARFVQLARDAGALSVLPLALATRSVVRLFAGEFAMASSLLEEVVAVNEATGASLAPYVGLAHVAFQGREAEATPLIEAATKELVRRGDGQGLRFIHWADRRAPQRPGPLRGGARRCAAGRRGHTRLVVARLGIGGADRGGRPEREGRARGRCARPAFAGNRGQWHRLGARASRPARGRC